MKKSITATLVGLTALTVSIGACGAKETGDAPTSRVGSSDNEDSPAVIVNMPDQYSNVAVKCVGTAMIGTTRSSNGRAAFAVADHPFCDDGLMTGEDFEQ